MEALLSLDLQLDCRAKLETGWQIQQLNHKLTLDPILCRSNMSDSGADKRKREGEEEDMPHNEDEAESPEKSPDKKRTKSGSEHILIYTKLNSCNNITEYNLELSYATHYNPWLTLNNTEVDCTHILFIFLVLSECEETDRESGGETPVREEPEERVMDADDTLTSGSAIGKLNHNKLFPRNPTFWNARTYKTVYRTDRFSVSLGAIARAPLSVYRPLILISKWREFQTIDLPMPSDPAEEEELLTEGGVAGPTPGNSQPKSKKHKAHRSLEAVERRKEKRKAKLAVKRQQNPRPPPQNKQNKKLKPNNNNNNKTSSRTKASDASQLLVVVRPSGSRPASEDDRRTAMEVMAIALSQTPGPSTREDPLELSGIILSEGVIRIACDDQGTQDRVVAILSDIPDMAVSPVTQVPPRRFSFGVPGYLNNLTGQGIVNFLERQNRSLPQGSLTFVSMHLAPGTPPRPIFFVDVSSEGQDYLRSHSFRLRTLSTEVVLKAVVESKKKDGRGKQ